MISKLMSPLKTNLQRKGNMGLKIYKLPERPLNESHVYVYSSLCIFPTPSVYTIKGGISGFYAMYKDEYHLDYLDEKYIISWCYADEFKKLMEK
jgi:hypothetical protein